MHQLLAWPQTKYAAKGVTNALTRRLKHGRTAKQPKRLEPAYACLRRPPKAIRDLRPRCHGWQTPGKGWMAAQNHRASTTASALHLMGCSAGTTPVAGAPGRGDLRLVPDARAVRGAVAGPAAGPAVPSRWRALVAEPAAAHCVPHACAAVDGRRRRGRGPMPRDRGEIAVAGAPGERGIVGATVHRAELRRPTHAVHVSRRHRDEADVRLHDGCARSLRPLETLQQCVGTVPWV